MSLTKSLLVKCSDMPISIIIVGVGYADFADMEELDGDGGPLKDDDGIACKRDVVQFVEFKDAVKRGNLAA